MSVTKCNADSWAAKTNPIAFYKLLNFYICLTGVTGTTLSMSPLIVWLLFKKDLCYRKKLIKHKQPELSA